MNSNVRWKERFSLFMQEMQRYTRYIFNGHFVIVLVIGLGGLAYYYSEWVDTLDSSFPAALLLAVVMAIPLTNSPVYTFLKEPDMFFLLPVETKLNDYFRRSIRLSLVFQGYILLMFLAVSMPLYAAVEDGQLKDFFYLFAILLVVKYFNIRIKWSILHFQEDSVRHIDSVVRYLLNFGLAFLLFSKASIVFVFLLFAVLVVLFLYFEKTTKHKLLKWELLIELENKRMMAFYRFANMFTDVPKLKEKIKRRQWLNPVMSLVGYRHDNTYSYLYVRTFCRSSDYLGLFVRLTLIGGFVLLSLTSLIPQIIGAGLFVYVTGFQLIAIRRQHENMIWHDLYPISESVKNQAVEKLLTNVLIVQGVILAVVALFTNSLLSFAAVLAISIVMILLLRSYYAKVIRKLQHKWD